MTTPADSAEWTHARARPLPRHGQPYDHDLMCQCRTCMRDDYDPAEEGRR